LSGSYIASGRDSDGSDYNCKAAISKDEDFHIVKWSMSAAEYESKGILSGNILMVSGGFNVTYEVKSDGTLVGRWGTSGSETLTPAPPGF
jgi:hypothetical protein